MSDQREHGVGGLEWRDLPARTPDTPLVPSPGARSASDDEATVFLPHEEHSEDNSGTGDRAGFPEHETGTVAGHDAAACGDAGHNPVSRDGGTSQNAHPGTDGRDAELPDGDSTDSETDELDGPTRRLAPVPGPVPFDTNLFDETMFGSFGDESRDESHAEDAPLDLAALRADDALLTALATHSATPVDPRHDVELKSLLQSWRLDVDAEAIGELVDVDTALATIAVGARIHKRKPRYLMPLATAAAVLVVAFAGVLGLVAHNAQPGDALWGLSQMLYADHAHSVEAAATVRSDLNHASAALAQGDFTEARTALVQAQASLPAVDTSDGKAGLQQQQQSLLDQLNNTALTPVSETSGGGTGYGVTSTTATSSRSASATTAPPVTTTTTVPVTTTTTVVPPTTTTPPPTTTDTDQSTQDAPGQPGQPTDPPVNNGPGDTGQAPVNNGPAQGTDGTDGADGGNASAVAGG